MIDISIYDETKITEICERMIDKNDRLDLIYIRVSTTNKGQRYEDQLPDIINTFELHDTDTILLSAKESAFSNKKDKNRKFNIIKNIIADYKEYDKTLYVWDLDRIYRNQQRQFEFICYEADKNNCHVLSHRQKIFHQFKEMGGMGKAMYNMMIQCLGWVAEEESKQKRDRQLKSLHIDHELNRTMTNNGKVHGRRIIKRIINKGKKNERKEYYSAKAVRRMERIVISARKNNIKYREIVSNFQKHGIKISQGWIASVIQRDEKRNKDN